jgi:hypothetical protein
VAGREAALLRRLLHFQKALLNTNIYIDGFNLYYGRFAIPLMSFQRTEWRRHDSEHEATGRKKIAGPSLRGSAISQIPTAPIGFPSIVVCFLLVCLVESCKKLA